MNSRKSAFTPAFQWAKLVAEKQVSPVELTDLYLRRIDELNPKLNAYITVTADLAMADAKDAERSVVAGGSLGPLHGVPISIKDLESTAGIRTTFGSLLFKDHIPNIDSGVVERVRNSGAIILGKTNTPEFGVSGTTENRLGDDCRNPWDIERTSGGSSGGAGAALAAGLCPVATGSDAGGSIRIPASFCGVYGIKPTLGRIPQFGGVAHPAPNQVAQAGSMSLTVKDSALLLQVLAGPDSRDVNTLREQPSDYIASLDAGVKGLKIAWSPGLGSAAVDPEVVSVTSEAAVVFEELGAFVEETEVNIPAEPYAHLNPIILANAYAAYGHFLEQRPKELSENTRDKLEQGKHITGKDYARALCYLEELKFQMDMLMDRYDLLLTPTMAVPAFPLNRRPALIAGRQVISDWAFNPFNLVFNITGQPSANIPCGFSADGLPIGLQAAGRVGDEPTVLCASAAFEEIQPWANKHPSLS